ncbi:hypothetical protein SLS56_000741 [Neofusicoccum ribis]|uniref:Uncharacterized protein n=1 Tax=Neofusicoccum ribis TaxID=45134 RepID=A0ABR3TBZ2_9PEZI
MFNHFAALNGSLDSIIVFLLDAPTTSNPPADQPTPLHAYTHLSATLFTDSSIADLPLLPLSSLASLAALLKTYITANSAARATQNFRARRGDAFNTALDLLPWCTANAARAPLGEDEVNVLTDLFGSVGELAKCAVEAVKWEREGEGYGDERIGVMMGLLGREVTDDVLEFWREEWVAE